MKTKVSHYFEPICVSGEYLIKFIALTGPDLLRPGSYLPANNPTPRVETPHTGQLSTGLWTILPFSTRPILVANTRTPATREPLAPNTPWCGEVTPFLHFFVLRNTRSNPLRKHTHMETATVVHHLQQIQ